MMAGAALVIGPFGDLLAVAPRDRVRGVDYEQLGCQRLAVIAANLLDRGLGHEEEDDVVESDRLVDGTRLRISGNCIKIQLQVGRPFGLVLTSFAGDISILQLLRATPGNKLGEVSPP
jgi:hypothetical protein